jgi:hypothetical protein
MRQIALASMLALGGALTASAGGVHVSVNIGAPYYGYAPADVVYVERYVPAYDVPRVLYVSRYGRVPPAAIVRHYRGGWGWNSICDRYRVPRAAFYQGGYGYGYRNSYRTFPRNYRGHGRDDRGYVRSYRGNSRGRGGWRD